MRKSFWVLVALVAALVAVGVVSAATSDNDKSSDRSDKSEETEKKGEAGKDESAKHDDHDDGDKGHEGRSGKKGGKHHGRHGKRHGYSMVFKAKLSGDQEVPEVKTETTGDFKLLVNSDRSKVKFSLRVRDGVGIFGGPGAHIHCAPAGENGPIVAWLAGGLPDGAGLDGRVKLRGMLSDKSIMATPDPKSDGATCPALITDIDSLIEAAKAGNLYVNVHSFEFMGGVVRGQIEQASHPRACHRARGKHRKVSTRGHDRKCVVKIVKGKSS